MESSIYADLKKFAGEIKAKKVTTMMPELALESEPDDDVINNVNNDNNDDDDNNIIRDVLKVVKKPTGKKARVDATVIPVPEVTIDTIAMMVMPPLVPIRDGDGYVHNASSLALKCPRGHIHKYWHKDITAGNVIKCLTCSSGNKFMIMVRECVETTFGVPFAVSENRLDNINGVEYTNPVLKITISCNRVAGIDTTQQINDYLLIKLHPTTSLKKIKDFLHASLINYVSEEYKPAVATLKPPIAKSAANAKMIFPKEPLPFTPELAAINIAGANMNPIIAQTRLNVITDDKLCLENC